MEIKKVMVPTSSIFDAQSSVCFAETAEAIVSTLNKSEIERYGRAMLKVQQGQGLNRRDLVVLDKIDQVTFDQHGMCLKDSQVTKARLKACKKYGREFIDRDHLVDHMNFMLPDQVDEPSEISLYQALGEFMASRLGIDELYELYDLIGRVEDGGELTVTELELLSKFEEVVSKELGLSIASEGIKSAINKASKKVGIYFQNLQEVISH